MDELSLLDDVTGEEIPGSPLQAGWSSTDFTPSAVVAELEPGRRELGVVLPMLESTGALDATYDQAPPSFGDHAGRWAVHAQSFSRIQESCP